MSNVKHKADWIAVDWGTSNLRAWAMKADGSVLGKASSAKGMGGLRKEEFEPALLHLISPWLGDGKTQVLACGMVGSRQGWAEATYRTVPTNALGETTKVNCSDPRISVSILPGIKQLKPADVMRGEETQISGFLSQDQSFDGVICLPGSHSKWAHISVQEIVSFQTFMTGELFNALSMHTVLQHSVKTDSWNDNAFEDAVTDALSRPEAIGAKLFNLRASELLEGAEKSVLRARLSGLLIGSELAAAKAYWLGQNVAIIGEPSLAKHYEKALKIQGVNPTCQPSDPMTLAGLTAAYREQSACLEI